MQVSDVAIARPQHLPSPYTHVGPRALLSDLHQKILSVHARRLYCYLLNTVNFWGSDVRSFSDSKLMECDYMTLAEFHCARADLVEAGLIEFNVIPARAGRNAAATYVLVPNDKTRALHAKHWRQYGR